MYLSRFIIVAFFFNFLLSGTFVQSFNNDNSNEKSNPRSFAGMMQMLHLEKDLIRNLEEYVDLLETKVHTIHLILNQIRLEHEKAECDAEEYLSNPLNGFSLIRRMHDDWSKLKNFMNQSVGQAHVDYMEQKSLQMPTISDINKAKDGIYSIQMVYGLKPADIAKGILNDKQYNSSLSTIDCFHMALYAYEVENFNASLDWHLTALNGYNPEYAKAYKVLGVDLAAMWHGVAETFFNMHKTKEALEAAELMISHDPDDFDKKNFVENLRNLLLSKKACQGKYQQNKRLRCKYDSSSSPFLKLAPFKMEPLQESPYLVLYHDVMYDHEIEQLKAEATPQLKRGLVGGGIIHFQRTSSAISFKYNHNRITQNMYTRTADITGFDVGHSKSMQVINYGLGGHYYNHVDYFLELLPSIKHLGNRKGAILYYLSDVEQGGATAFPAGHSSVFPKKGSAIVWYHLNNAGDGDAFSLHSGCPVLFGSKWIMIHMMFDGPQIFKKPCLANHRYF